MGGKKPHFKGVGKRKFHAERTGTCDLGGGKRTAQDAPAMQAPQKTGCDYAGNTQQTHRREAKLQPQRAHHILPLTVYKRYKKDGSYKTFDTAITAAMHNTSYCANQSPNMKWLPLKVTYWVRPAAKTSNKPWAMNVSTGSTRVRLAHKDQRTGWDLELPCHDFGHDAKEGGYINDVTVDFKQLWDEIKNDQQNEKKCFNEDDVIQAIRNLEGKWRTYLDTLSPGRGGTRNALEKYEQMMKAGNTGILGSHWWLPFSMASKKTAMQYPLFGLG